MPELIFFRRGEEVLRFVLDRPRTILGRGEKSDVVIPDPSVSRQQVVIRLEGEVPVLEDLSGRGTIVSGAISQRAVLSDGTDIALGQWRAVYRERAGIGLDIPTQVSEARAEPPARESEPRSPCSFQGLVGDDPSIRQLVELIERISPSSAAVAIFGESGTGKELVARAIHSRSSRNNRLFVPVNCAAISRDLIESELFGHEKGAFTGATNARKGAFEEADGGTLFLDEIGDLPLDLQAKLLRALESGEIRRVGASRPIHVDVRIVAATNRNLLAATRECRFREDLYYRLCVVPLHLTPLRSRYNDIVHLAEHFVKLFSPRGQRIRLSREAVEKLKAHSWPGNIRELKNVVHRALLFRRGPTIDAGDLAFDQEVNRETGIAVPEIPVGMTLDHMLENLERQIVEGALRRFNNNRERVARELGVARSTLFKRLKDWGLTRQSAVLSD